MSCCSTLTRQTGAGGRSAPLARDGILSVPRILRDEVTALTAVTAEHQPHGIDPRTVRGLEGLRVVDASVMPGEVTANIHPAVLGIAERAADLIKSSR